MFETLVVQSRGVKIVRTLYGTITPERLEKEKRDLEHQLNQLTPLTEQERADIADNFDYTDEDDEDGNG